MTDRDVSRGVGSDTSPHHWLEAPEVNVLMFSFLVNVPWEFWQAPFFAGLAQSRHWEAVVMCTRAAFGDALISLFAFWTVAIYSQKRRWIINPTRYQQLAFIAVGLLITIALEVLATSVFGRWHYAGSMPIVPAIGVGLLPILQWVVLPPLVLWFVRRQLR